MSISHVTLRDIDYAVTKKVYLGRTIITIKPNAYPEKHLVDTTSYHGVTTGFDSSAIPLAYGEQLSAFTRNAQQLKEARAKTVAALQMSDHEKYLFNLQKAPD